MVTRRMSCYWCGAEFARHHDGPGWWLCPACRVEYATQHTYTCEVCGERYSSGTGSWDPAGRVGYCTDACRGSAAARARPRRAEDTTPLSERHCELCGRAFEPVRADSRFCSGRCRAVAYRRRGHAY